ncbi:hypothetical protein JW865_03815 [Candidatus Bathyarchaeota archaeon]|nr:hypothetical protein [Candidatus Bathyarchaeota archaeon]
MKPCICDDVFKDFKWLNLKEAQNKDICPTKGVYALRLQIDNSDPFFLENKLKHTIEFAENTIKKSEWKELISYYSSRIQRLKQIEPLICPIIYIGAVGKGKGTLRGRFIDLAGHRHTVFYPIFCLLSTGWEIEFGYKNIENDVFKIENQFKEQYENKHGKYPALVKK